ncbi:MAG TPA: glycosyltransferase family 4 protein [Chloroflexia bacterium]|nr:glycosyltransferase family 4 protein [Chloroflexia bacterium]
MTRVLLVPAAYLPTVGGVQTVVAQVAAELRAVGHHVELLTQRHPRTLPASEVVAGVPVHRFLFLLPLLKYLRQRRPDLFAGSLFYLPYSWLACRQLLRRFRPDVVHIHYVGAPAAFVLRPREHRSFRLVVTVHGYDVTGWAQQTRVERRLFQATLHGADVVTAPVQPLLDQALAIVPAAAARARVIPNGVDIARFAAATPFTWSRPYILGLGRLTWAKGFDTLLDAYVRLAQGYDLLVGGDGEDEPRLRQQIYRLGIGDRVTLLGKVAPSAVPGLMAGARLLVMPSRREPFGLVALEGLAAGVPVVATHVGGLPDVLTGTGSRLVPADDPAALAAAMREMLAAPRAARVPLAADWSWAAVAQRYAALYEHCLSPAGACSG